MAKFYITLGQSHQHIIDNRIWEKNSVLEIEAESVSQAEQYAFNNLGNKWAMCTDESQHKPEFYPKGIIKSITI